MLSSDGAISVVDLVDTDIETIYTLIFNSNRVIESNSIT